jgi:3-hydroxyacyl-[acyl-carrier-protein] dehydratase
VRWFWIDRFVEFVSGSRAVALKAITLAEPQLNNYSPGFPVMPAPIIIEGFAQTGGLLVSEMHDFLPRTVLAKVGKAKFHVEALPGETLRYEVTLQDAADDGAIVHGRALVEDRLQSEVELFFAYLDDRFHGVDLFHPADYLGILRLLGVYDVGCKSDGSPLQVPVHLLKAEEERNRSGQWVRA